MCAHTHTVILRYIAGLHASNKQTKNKKLASVQCLVHGGELNFPAVHSSKWVQKNPVIRWYLTGSFVAAPIESESLEVQMHWTSRWCIAPAVLAVVPSPISFFVVCSFCFLHEITKCSGVAEFLEDGPWMSINSGFHFQSIQSNEQFLPWRGQSTRGTHVGNHEPIWLFCWVLPLPWEGARGRWQHSGSS